MSGVLLCCSGVTFDSTTGRYSGASMLRVLVVMMVMACVVMRVVMARCDCGICWRQPSTPWLRRKTGGA